MLSPIWPKTTFVPPPVFTPFRVVVEGVLDCWSATKPNGIRIWTLLNFPIDFSENSDKKIIKRKWEKAIKYVQPSNSLNSLDVSSKLLSPPLLMFLSVFVVWNESFCEFKLRKPRTRRNKIPLDICANIMWAAPHNCQIPRRTSHIRYPLRWLSCVFHDDTVPTLPTLWMIWILKHTPVCIPWHLWLSAICDGSII